mmetsp:Transcript_55839/g.130837  ORF Transcript_55839/g.130837 Transcript_55839/m.130837 type:complete len:293 (+) Transcript_55839:529-1407(+)
MGHVRHLFHARVVEEGRQQSDAEDDADDHAGDGPARELVVAVVHGARGGGERGLGEALLGEIAVDVVDVEGVGVGQGVRILLALRPDRRLHVDARGQQRAAGAALVGEEGDGEEADEADAPPRGPAHGAAEAQLLVLCQVRDGLVRHAQRHDDLVRERVVVGHVVDARHVKARVEGARALVAHRVRHRALLVVEHLAAAGIVGHEARRERVLAVGALDDPALVLGERAVLPDEAPRLAAPRALVLGRPHLPAVRVVAARVARAVAVLPRRAVVPVVAHEAALLERLRRKRLL